MRRPAPEVARRPRRSTRGRGLLVAAGVLLLLVITLSQGVATVYTDFLWFSNIDLGSLWRELIVVKATLVVLFTGGVFALVWANLRVADRIAPRFRPIGSEDEIVARYQEVVAPHASKVRIGVAALFALIVGGGAAAQWENWLLFRNSVDFGTDDPQFGQDIGFYVFRLPFLSWFVDWLFIAFIIVLLLTAAAHYLNGGIRVQAAGQRVGPQVKVHLSVLLGVLALIKAGDYWLQRYELVFSGRGPVRGASFTDIHAQLPALNLLVAISLAAVALFLANIWLRGWLLPAIAVVLWGVVAVLVGGIYPAFVQKFRVEPDEAAKERPYIERNITATRAAMAIDNVNERSFAHEQSLTSQDLAENSETIRNIRLWDPPILRATYQRLQEVRDFFQFSDVDVDRYEINGETTQVVLSARDLDPEGLPSERKSWINRHLQFTHGYGAVLSPANAVTAEGQPDFLVKDVPPETVGGGPEITQPEIYFGEDLGGYAIANTDQGEIDYVTSDGTDRTSRYQGDGGVELSSPLRRAAMALRLREFKVLLGDSIRPESRVIFRRDIEERARTVAPFLLYDGDPYPVILDGRIKWIIDAYTATDRYPYAERAPTATVPGGNDLRGAAFNYVRNSVKVVIDAYDGDLTFYVIDDQDPIVAAWAKAFPDLFTSNSEVPDNLRAHFRYPEDLFRVQTAQFATYHINSASDLYSRSDAWDISPDPGSGRVQTGEQRQTTPTTSAATLTEAFVVQREQKMDPYYLLMRLPEAQQEEFLLLQSFVPFSRDDSRKELTAFMVAKSDPENYGQLEVFVMPRDQQVDGPAIIGSRIQQDPAISEQITLLSRAGSEVLLGNLLIIPVEDSLLYVRPMYVQAEQTPVPEFKFAIVVYKDSVVMRPTLKDALAAIFGEAPETLEEAPTGVPTPDPGQPGVALPDSVRALLEQAAAAFDAAQTALQDGDLGEYQRQVRRAQELVAEARRQSAASPEGGTDQPSPTTTTPPPSDA